MITIHSTATSVMRVYDSLEQRAADRVRLVRMGFDSFTEYADVNGPALQAGHYRPYYDLRPWDSSQGSRGMRISAERFIAGVR